MLVVFANLDKIHPAKLWAAAVAQLRQHGPCANMPNGTLIGNRMPLLLVLACVLVVVQVLGVV